MLLRCDRGLCTQGRQTPAKRRSGGVQGYLVEPAAPSSLCVAVLHALPVEENKTIAEAEDGRLQRHPTVAAYQWTGKLGRPLSCYQVGRSSHRRLLAKQRPPDRPYGAIELADNTQAAGLAATPVVAARCCQVSVITGCQEQAPMQPASLPGWRPGDRVTQWRSTKVFTVE